MDPNDVWRQLLFETAPIPEDAGPSVPYEQLQHELCGLFAAYETSRIPSHRGPEFIRAWVAEQVEHLGPSQRYYLAAPSFREWRAVSENIVKHRLPSLLTPEALGWALILGDSARVLAFVNAHVGSLHAAVHPVGTIVESAENRQRLTDLLQNRTSILPCAFLNDNALRLDSSAVFQGLPRTTCGLDAPRSRKEQWFRDAFAAFDSHRGADKDSEQSAFHEVSLGSAGPVSWLLVSVERDPDWFLAFLADPPPPQVFVTDGSHEFVLGIRATAEKYEAFLYTVEGGDGPSDPRRAT